MNKAQRHYEESALIPTSPEELFTYVDDHKRFSSHMGKSSWMMGGGRMDTSVDAGRGREIGSHIRMKVGIEPQEDGSLLRVSIGYNLPKTNTWLGRLFSGMYAKWCVQQMIQGTRDHFTK